MLHLGGLGGAWAGAGMPSVAWAAAQTALASRNPADSPVRLTGDGLGLTPAQYAQVLAGLAERGIAADDYILGGVVEELESRMAALLGKERAVFMPTGTLANNLAIRTLAGGSGRAVVQADSHIYLDSGDCVQTLSNVTLMPLGEGRATFKAEELERLLEKNNTGRVATPIRVVSIESPVRRMRGQIFDPAELGKVIAAARKAGVRLHLDGARLFLEAAYARKNVADYAKPFDTVYVSLYKVLQRVVRRDPRRARATCSTACFTRAGCSGAGSARRGHLPRWPCTTWTASRPATARRSTCRKAWRSVWRRTRDSPSPASRPAPT